MNSFTITAATLVCIFTILAAGLNIQWGLTRLANFGIMGFFALGAYVTALASSDPTLFGTSTSSALFAWGLPWVVSAAIALAVSAVVAVGLEQVLRRTQLEPVMCAVVTLAFGEILMLVIRTEKGIANGFNGIFGIPRPLAGQISFYDYDRYFLIGTAAAAIAVTLVVRRISRSGYGRVLRAIREHPDAVAAMGYDVASYRRGSFVIGAVMMAFAGALWAPFQTVVEPTAFLFIQTILVWAVVVIGGTGNPFGPIVGAVAVVGLLQQGTRFLNLPGFLEGADSLIRTGLIGLLLMLFIRFRPQGILAERVR